MRFASLFAGIGGFDLAFEAAGGTCSLQVENDPYPRSVLERHWPDIPRIDDVKEVDNVPEGIDLICGGFPCTDLSVAGRRAGLDGERSGLWWEYHRIIERNRPQWVVIENVPGLFSSNDGADFLALIRSLTDIGYGTAWRVLDARHFGVPQRRRRVVIVGHSSGSAHRAGEALFEPERSTRDLEPCRPSQPVVTQLTASSLGGGGATSVSDLHTHDPESAAGGHLLPTIVHATQDPIVTVDGCHALSAKETPVVHTTGVRKLTPLECERLQGFPDNWTDNLSDTRRYKAVGNAVAVPVFAWIARRIAAANNIEVAA